MKSSPPLYYFILKILKPLQVVILIFLTVTPDPLLAKKISTPKNFVDVITIIPSIVLDIRYYTPHNFVGEKIDGYNAPKCLLTNQAAQALAKVQELLLRQSLSLKVYDCYRPQRAVNHFVRWSKDPDDIKTKKEFYPTVDKRKLFKDGYLATRSSHSRGSTLDLTIVPVPTPPQADYTPGQTLFECYLPADQRFKDNSIDMGTGFDCLHDLSHFNHPKLDAVVHQNRQLLKTFMEKYGFENYDKEWWHYSFKNEPYPNTYFDFIIE